MTAAGRRRASQAGTGAQLRVFNLVWTSLIVIHIWAAPVEALRCGVFDWSAAGFWSGISHVAMNDLVL